MVYFCMEKESHKIECTRFCQDDWSNRHNEGHELVGVEEEMVALVEVLYR